MRPGLGRRGAVPASARRGGARRSAFFFGVWVWVSGIVVPRYFLAGAAVAAFFSAE